ncbi:hypothetical protein [Streptodolium elevatio]|uniref:Uncharacterized protein n=1 Tax=Streptodolium elevatio TaxID=3157996 RepID=A0ABV3DG89_9ACTN
MTTATATATATAATDDDDGELRGWGRSAAFVAIMVPVFVSALVIGRLTGPEAPDADRPQRPAAVPSQTSGGGGGGGGHNNHGSAQFGTAFAPTGP